MANYGTMPTLSSPESPPSSNADHVNQKIKQNTAPSRPALIMFDFRSFRPPTSVSDAIARIQTNISYFKFNYAMIVFLIINLTLPLNWRTVTMLIFITATWILPRILRRYPLVIFRRLVDGWMPLIAISAITVVLVLYRADFITLGVILVVVVGHAALRKTDDLYLEEEEAAGLTPHAAAAGVVASK